MSDRLDTQWIDGVIDDVVLKPLRSFDDGRGWLMEFFRHDELDAGLHPVMGYVSSTAPGIARGPHEHRHQTDLFVFFHGTFRLYLWDARHESPTRNVRQILAVGESNPCTVIVPPGIVHGYRNVGQRDALIINCPNKLYAGEGKTGPVDEIRHEDRPGGPFIMGE